MHLNTVEIMDRALNTGNKIEVRDFDMKVFKETSRLVKKYKINFDRENIVNLDDDLADRLFEAGKEFYMNMGTYTMETKRVINFSEKEIDFGLNNLPSQITIGTGKDSRIMKARKVEDPSLPIILGGVIGGKATEKMLLPLYMSIAQESLVDSFYFDPPHEFENRMVMFGTPLEIYSARSTTLKIREVLQRTGRPGMHILGGAGSALADMSTCWEGGVRETDGICAHTTSELKVDFDSLNKIMHTLQYGCCRQVWWAPVIGGFAGGAEGSAIAAVGGLFHSVLVGQAYLGSSYLNLQVTPYYDSGATDRLSLWILSVAGQAIARNSNAIIQGSVTTCAGPGTKMMYYEMAASVLAQVVSGYHIFGVRIQKPTKDNHGTGLESRWLAEVARAAVSLDRKDINRIINKLLEKYESSIGKAPEGFNFEELYDIDTIRPRTEYLNLYDEVKQELRELGIPFKT